MRERKKAKIVLNRPWEGWPHSKIVRAARSRPCRFYVPVPRMGGNGRGTYAIFRVVESGE